MVRDRGVFLHPVLCHKANMFSPPSCGVIGHGVNGLKFAPHCFQTKGYIFDPFSITSCTLSTVNFLNIRTPKKFVVIILKVEQDGVSLE